MPTQLALWWIDSVAALVPRLPLGRLGAVHVVLLFLFGAFGLRQASRLGRGAALVGLVVTLGHPAVALATMPHETQMVDADSVIWHDDNVTVLQVAGRSQPEQILSTLRMANIDEIDLVIVEQSSFANASLIGWLRTHYRVHVVWAPAITMGVGEVIPETVSGLLVDGVILTTHLDGDRLEVHAVIHDKLLAQE